MRRWRLVSLFPVLLLAAFLAVPPAAAGEPVSFAGTRWKQLDSSIPLKVRVKHEGKGSFELDGALLIGDADGRNGWLLLYPEEPVVEEWANPAFCGYNCLAAKLAWTQQRRRVTCTPDTEYVEQIVRVAMEQGLGLDHEQWSVDPTSVRLKAKIRRSGDATKVRLKVRFTATPVGEAAAATRKGKLTLRVVLPREPSR